MRAQAVDERRMKLISVALVYADRAQNETNSGLRLAQYVSAIEVLAGGVSKNRICEALKVSHAELKLIGYDELIARRNAFMHEGKSVHLLRGEERLLQYLMLDIINSLSGGERQNYASSYKRCLDSTNIPQLIRELSARSSDWKVALQREARLEDMADGFIDELRGTLGAGAVLSGAAIDARYFHDMAGKPVDKPRAVVRPKTTEDVSALLKLCHREKVPVTTQGGMTGLVRGGLPNAGEIVLSMELMNKVEEVDTSSGVAIAQAGTPLQKIQERVEQDGFMFPLDLGSRGSCTIGGNISTNAGGNRVIRYGMTRDMVLGLEVVKADGTVLKGLRKYIKNNTGVDLKHLFIGSEGILGVVTRAALRLFPAPAERQVALCALPSFGQVATFLKLARQHLGGELSAFEVMWNEYYRFTVERVKGVTGPLATNHPFYVLLEASGGDAERIHADLEKLLELAMEGNMILDATLSTSNASAAAIWRIRDSSVELGRSFPYAARMGFDVSLAIDRMEEYVDTIGTRIKQLDPGAFAIAFGHAGDGNLHIGVHHEHTPEKHHDFEDLVYGITGEFGGSISAEHGIGVLKKPYLKMSRTAEEIETMRTLKRAMDPHNILNPGRIISVYGD